MLKILINRSEKLQSEAPESPKLAEAHADALLLKQTRAELAKTPLDVPAELSVEKARDKSAELIDKAMGIRLLASLLDKHSLFCVI